MFMPRKILEEKLKQLLADDTGSGDVTSAAVVPLGLASEAIVKAKEVGTLAGLEEATVLAESAGLKVKKEAKDGTEIRKGQTIMKLSGDARTILSIERTLLNLVSRMSGIATTTKKLAEKLRRAKSEIKIAATRKTAPGLHYFDKKAVFIGGGDPHRLNLGDMILIKENHIVVAGSIEKAMRSAKQNASFSKKIEIEVNTKEDALKAAEAGADIIMLDNFTPKQIEGAIELLRQAGFLGKILLEASGGITPENLWEYATTQIDMISLGALTHSTRALDLTLDISRDN